MQAIGQAGGFAKDADRVAASVLRTLPDGSIRSVPVPASDEVAEIGKDPVLEHGDLVVVPRLDRIFVIGQVAQPGAVILPNQEKLTLSKAISLRGGFTRYAREGGVILIREGENLPVDVNAILKRQGPQRPELQPGDTVYVPASRF